MAVEAWLERAAAAAPSAIAVHTPSGACSYAELLARARAGSGQLAARGVGRGEWVAIALPASLDFVCALHACMLLGAVAVPVDLRLGERERAAIVGRAVAVVDEPLRAAGPAGLAAGAVHDLDAVAAVIHTSGTTSAPKPVELTYGNFLWSALGSAVALGLDPRERWLCNLPLSHVGGLSILMRSAIYATTAVVHERFDAELALRAILGEASSDAHRWEAPAGPLAKAPAGPLAKAPAGPLAKAPAGHLAKAPAGHLAKAPAGHLAKAPAGPLAEAPAGPSAGIPAGRAQVSDALPGRPVTLVSLVATTLTRLLDAGLERPPALRCALTGGGPVPVALLERARAAGVPVSLTYGMTEACSQVTTLPLGDLGMLAETGTDPPNRGRPAAATAGPPLFCTRVRTATDGEIEVAGPTLARGVAGEDGWLRTGDLGRLNGEGSLLVTGRKADTIVSGGENVAPTEVEAVLEEYPGVLEAAAIGRADERWGEAVTALVVARSGVRLRSEELRAHCAARLAPYKVPKQVALVEGPLPRTGSGKLLRRELR